MTKTRLVHYLFALCLGISIAYQAHANYRAAELDVIQYDVTIEPDIAAKTIKGTVKLAFVSQADEVEFNCGWLRPTREDRILVYDKGAYVMHLLREEIGERAFWHGLRAFTRRHFGKSVVTSDFTSAMEETAGKV